VRIEIDVNSGISKESPDDVAISKSNSELMAEELVALSNLYKSNLQQLQLNWLTASVSNGTAESSKKLAITQSISTLRTQYLSDILTVKQRYT